MSKHHYIIMYTTINCYQITDRLKKKKNNEKHPFIRAENIVGREEGILWF